jgi:inhibitor of KinA
MTCQYPRLRFVGDAGILVEFGDHIDEAIHDRVLKLDHAVTENPFHGFTSCIPSYVALLVGYDPCDAEPSEVEAHIRALLETPSTTSPAVRTHEVPVCYDHPYAPDLLAVAAQLGLGVDDVVESHLSVTYRVYMYGFAPGFAYLGGVPHLIQIPRRAEPVRGVPAGSLIIAGPQCIVTTLEMPSGWWNIGRSPAAILRPEHDQPFLFGVGDHIRFVRIDPVEFELLAGKKNAG